MAFYELLTRLALSEPLQSRILAPPGLCPACLVAAAMEPRAQGLLASFKACSQGEGQQMSSREAVGISDSGEGDHPPCLPVGPTEVAFPSWAPCLQSTVALRAFRVRGPRVPRPDSHVSVVEGVELLGQLHRSRLLLLLLLLLLRLRLRRHFLGDLHQLAPGVSEDADGTVELREEAPAPPLAASEARREREEERPGERGGAGKPWRGSEEGAGEYQKDALPGADTSRCCGGEGPSESRGGIASGIGERLGKGGGDIAPGES